MQPSRTGQHSQSQNGAPQQRQHAPSTPLSPLALPPPPPAAPPSPAAAAGDEPDDPGSPQSPGGSGWSMPATFLPPPEGFSLPGVPAGSSSSSKVIDLRPKTHAQLMALAAQHNKRMGVPEDPFQAVLAGIPERAKLRPDSKVATTFSLGNVPPDSPYAKAWRVIKRPGSKAAAKAAEAATAKRAEVAAAAVRPAKPQGSAQPPPVPRHQHQELPPEQVRWRLKLAAFLGRPVELPPLAPGAPLLDLNKLFLEVMSQGGSAVVTANGGWPALASLLQRDAEVAGLLAAAYDCFLHPLERDLPSSCRPARNIDHLEVQTKLRSELGCRVAPYEAVAFAADRAARLLKQLAPFEQQRQQQQQQANQQQQQQGQQQQADEQQQQQQANQQQQQQHGQQQQDQGRRQQQQQQQQQGQQQQEAAGVAANAGAAAAAASARPATRALPVAAALKLLREAAVLPHAVVQLVQQLGLQPALHGPSHAACAQQVKRAKAKKRPGSAAAAAAAGDDDSEEDDDDDDDDLFVDLSGQPSGEAQWQPQPAAAAAAAAASKDQQQQQQKQDQQSGSQQDKLLQQQQQKEQQQGLPSAAPKGHAAQQQQQQKQGKPQTRHQASRSNGVAQRKSTQQQQPQLMGKEQQGRGSASTSSDIQAADDDTPGSSSALSSRSDVGRDGSVGPTAKRTRRDTAVSQQQQQQQQPAGPKATVSQQQGDRQHQAAPQPAPACAEPPAGLLLDAARWLLVSRRAVRSGPPGCDKQILMLGGSSGGGGGLGRGGWHLAPPAAGGAVRPGGAARQVTADGTPRLRTFLGITPKCGACKTCTHPSMKKACLTNRERMAQGLPPILPVAAKAK